MAVGNLVANLTANTSGFSKGLTDARSQLTSFSSSMVGQLTSVSAGFGRISGGIFNQLGRAGLAAQGINAITSAAKGMVSALSQPVRLFADLEQNQVSFETMLGSAEEATTLLRDIRQLAASTPLQTTDINQAAKTLLQFGVSGENVIATMRMLGDVTGGDAERFRSMSLAFGQMSSAGRLMGQDLLQMINAGFNPLQTMSEQTGKSVATLKKEMEAGGISSAEVTQAFQAATSSGGRFFNLMEKQSKTVTGLWSTMKDNISIALTDVGQAIVEGFNLKGLIADVASFAASFGSSFLPSIVGTINVVGQVFQGIVATIKASWSGWTGDTAAQAEQWSATLGVTVGAWVPEVLLAVNQIVSLFAGMISTVTAAWNNWLGGTLAVLFQWRLQVGTTIGSWITPFLEQVADLFANFDLYLLIAVEHVGLFATNAISQVSTFFTNVGEWLAWFGDNWQSVLFTVGDYAMTVFINLGQNIRDLWTGVLDFIAGNGFTFDPTPLTEGFASAIGELPDLTQANIQESTAELERLYGELGKRQADAQAKGMAEAAKITAPKLDLPTGNDIKLPDSASSVKDQKKLSGAAEFGSREAASIIANSVAKGRDPVADNTKKMVELQKQTLTALKEKPASLPLIGLAVLP